MMPASNSKVDDIPAESINQYYYSSKNVKRSKIDTYQTTNAIYSLNTPTGGSTSTVVVPSNAGLSHFVLSATLPDQVYNGLALPSGWLYRMINNITYRYAGSSQWSATGDMLKVCAVVNAGNKSESQALIDIGGNALYEPADFQIESNRTACIPLTLAHISSQSGVSTPLPLDSSLLKGGPITITITWNRLSDVFASAVQGGDGLAISTIPNIFEESFLAVRQVLPFFRDDLLKMNGNESYMYPITWYQPENQATLQSKTDVQSVNLVGIKQGDALGIYCWVTKSNNTAAGLGPTASAQAIINANGSTFVPVKSAQFSYAGTILQVFNSVAHAQIMDTLFNDCPSYYQTANISLNVANDNLGQYFALTANNPSSISTFLHCPFSQRIEQGSGMGTGFVIQNGVGLNNGSVGLDIAIGETPSAGDIYTLHYMPYFNASLAFRGDQVDYMF